jgi:UDP-GlcNAc:undecaprenyl-phosphate/decaprenyl-phosphate GlcNAc-1-phosphate transferase
MSSVASQEIMGIIISSGLLACLLSLALMPICINVSARLGFVDQPDNFRKLHRQSVPATGGVAVLLAYFLSLVFACLTITSIRAAMSTLITRNLFLILAVLVVFLVGLADDLKGLAPLQKLFGQVVAAALASFGGLSIQFFHNAVPDRWISPILTMGWLVLSTNAFNLIDGLDGLASGVGLFATLAIAVGAVRDHNAMLLLVTVPLAGCLLGFLRYNFAPASIFLGDCGSLSIGFLLGCFGLMWGGSITTLAGLTAPLMALSLPLAETSVTILRRTLRSRPVFGGDREHIHHRLLDRGNSVRKTALLLYGVCAVGAGFSVLQRILDERYGTPVFIAFLFLVLLGIRHLNYTEFSLFQRLLARGTLFRLIDDQILLHSLHNQLRGATSLPDAIELIRPVGRHFGFQEVYASAKGLTPSILQTDAPFCEISISMGDDCILVLRGTPDKGRPFFALDQLIRIISTCAQSHWLPGVNGHGATLSHREPIVGSPVASLAGVIPE